MEESLKIYCRDCGSITEHRVKGARERVLVCNICNSTNMPITLVKNNGEIHHGIQVRFVEFEGDEIGSRAKQLHKEPQIGYSVILDPQYALYTWLTTPIKEIESDGEMRNSRCITFKTQNSDYKLYITKI